MNDDKIERPERSKRPERTTRPVGKDGPLEAPFGVSETTAVHFVYMLAIESLDPELFGGLEDALKSLAANRNLYVNFDGVLTGRGK